MKKYRFDSKTDAPRLSYPGAPRRPALFRTSPVLAPDEQAGLRVAR